MSIPHPWRHAGAARLATFGVAVAAAVALAGGTGAPASATQAAAPASAPATITAKLVLDCTHMTPAAHRYAVAHRYCPPGAQTGRSTGTRRSPDNTVPGDCGDSFIYLKNLGHGNAEFRYGFHSSLGIVVSRTLEVAWSNNLFGKYGGWPDNSLMFSSSYTPDPRTVRTGQGDVQTGLTGSVRLIWGATCDLLIPTDEATIT
ncbi:MAG TPA: hypothetical protein VKP11_01735 [Frankiaceae bacterium]|nr:hypothetical protein [Frankiaceae bacterium]